MRYVITGATGELARRTTEEMLGRVEAGQLVLVTRSPDKLAELAARGADVRYGDFDRPESLADAFAGGERMLLTSTQDVGRRATQHAAAIDAARGAGVRHVAYTSILNPTPANPAGAVPDHRATEEHLAASGLRWAFLRNALYSEYRLPEAQTAIGGGTLRTNLGTGSTAFVSRADCAAVAAAVLAGGDEHDGQAYDVTGPQLLGARDLADLYSAAGGRPVALEPVSDQQVIDGLIGAGLSREGAALIASFGTAIREGQLGQLTTVVADLAGRPAVPVHAVLAAGLADA